jgi:hypothetical protein
MRRRAKTTPGLVWALYALLALAVCVASAAVEHSGIRSVLLLLSGIGIGGLVGCFLRSGAARGARG